MLLFFSVKYIYYYFVKYYKNFYDSNIINFKVIKLIIKTIILKTLTFLRRTSYIFYSKLSLCFKISEFIYFKNNMKIFKIS